MSYIEALKTELEGAVDKKHIAEIKAELKKFGEKIVDDVIETASSDTQHEVARVSKSAK